MNALFCTYVSHYIISWLLITIIIAFAIPSEYSLYMQLAFLIVHLVTVYKYKTKCKIDEYNELKEQINNNNK